MSQVKTLISSEQIQIRLNELAKQIKADYGNAPLILIAVLKGSYMLLSDLSKALWREGLTELEIDFLGISSYDKNTETSRNPRITYDLSTDIQNRHVLIVEDIIDTGYSLDALHRLLKSRHPASLKTLVLLSKESRREINVPVDYIGFKVEGWVGGYGLDFYQKYRHRAEVVVLTE